MSEGTTVGVELGKEKPLIRCPEWLPGDIPHDRAAHLNCMNGGTMDGFGNGEFGSTYAYSIFDEDQIPNYCMWAREYALSDHFFASVSGPRTRTTSTSSPGSPAACSTIPRTSRRGSEDGQRVQELGLRCGR